MTSPADARPASALAVSPTGKLHAYRNAQTRTACGLDLQRKRFGRRNAAVGGWHAMAGDWAVYVALADGRTCKLCEDGMRLNTGPGA